MRILICEDNKDNADTMAAWFRHMGAEVRACNDGVACVEAARGWPPDVALLDIGMPGMSGFDVARELRALPDRKIFLIAISGWGTRADRKRALEAGFHVHLAKPADLAGVWNLIRDALGPA